MKIILFEDHRLQYDAYKGLFEFRGHEVIDAFPCRIGSNVTTFFSREEQAVIATQKAEESISNADLLLFDLCLAEGEVIIDRTDYYDKKLLSVDIASKLYTKHKKPTVFMTAGNTYGFYRFSGVNGDWPIFDKPTLNRLNRNFDYTESFYECPYQNRDGFRCSIIFNNNDDRCTCVECFYHQIISSVL